MKYLKLPFLALALAFQFGCLWIAIALSAFAKKMRRRQVVKAAKVRIEKARESSRMTKLVATDSRPTIEGIAEGITYAEICAICGNDKIDFGLNFSGERTVICPTCQPAAFPFRRGDNHEIDIDAMIEKYANDEALADMSEVEFEYEEKN